MNSNLDLENRIIEAENLSGIKFIKDKRGNLIWPYIRMYFYYWYVNQVENSSFNRAKINFDLIRNVLNCALNFKLLLLVFGRRKDVMIISSQRYSEGQEIYTHDIKTILKSNYDEFSFSRHFNLIKGPIYLDIVKIFFKILSFFFSRFVKPSSVVIDFKSCLNLEESFIKLYKTYYFEYKLWYKFYQLVLHIRKYKKVVIVGGVYYAPLIAVADKNNIEVVELQHGVIHDHHLAYNFKNIPRRTFFAHKLFVYSDYWKNSADFPDDVELVTVGNARYNSGYYINYMGRAGLLFIGSPLNNSIIFEFLRNNLDKFKEEGMKVTFRLHPYDVPLWKSNYLELLNWVQCGLIDICDGTLSLKDRLLSSSVVFCTDSTVVYESIWFGCKTFVFDGTHTRFLSRIVNEGSVHVIDMDTLFDNINVDFYNEEKLPVQYFTGLNLQYLKEYFKHEMNEN